MIHVVDICTVEYHIILNLQTFGTMPYIFASRKSPIIVWVYQHNVQFVPDIHQQTARVNFDISFNITYLSRGGLSIAEYGAVESFQNFGKYRRNRLFIYLFDGIV